MKNLELHNVLFIALSGIGNLLMQMPTIETLKRKRPNTKITVWVAPRGTKKLAESLPYIDEIMEAPYKGSLKYHFNLINTLRTKKFSAGIVLSPGQLIKSAAYLYLAGIPVRIGNSYPLGNNSHSSFLLTHGIEENRDLHDIEQNLRLLEPLDISIPTVPHYNLDVSSKQDEARKLLGTCNIDPTRTLVGFHMGSAPDFLWKRWPQENFIQLGKELINNHNAHILLFGGPDEDDIKEEVRKALGDHSSPISADLLTTAAIMQLCAYTVSNDSGLMHLGAAAGAKVYGLFGPTSEIQTGPRGAHSTVIRASGTTPIYATESNYSLGSEPHQSMKDITVQMVLEKISG